MRTIERYIYVVLKNKKAWSQCPTISHATKRAPKLKAGQVAIRLVLTIPDNILDPVTVPLVVHPLNLIRPTITVTQ